MRGSDRQTGQLFSYISPEAMVPKGHPLRVIRELAKVALERPSIPPEQLQAFHTVRSERQLVEQLGYNMLFPWFVAVRPSRI